jgi:hypothetical protein
VSTFAIVTFLRQLLSISDVNYRQFLFFYFKQEYAALRLLQKYTKIMDHILFLHIRSNLLLRYANQNNLSLLHTALVGNYISSNLATIFAGKSYQQLYKVSQNKIAISS